MIWRRKNWFYGKTSYSLFYYYLVQLLESSWRMSDHSEKVKYISVTRSCQGSYNFMVKVFRLHDFIRKDQIKKQLTVCPHWWECQFLPSEVPEVDWKDIQVCLSCVVRLSFPGREGRSLCWRDQLAIWLHSAIWYHSLVQGYSFHVPGSVLQFLPGVQNFRV